jgi:hypothetical protein
VVDKDLVAPVLMAEVPVAVIGSATEVSAAVPPWAIAAASVAVPAVLAGAGRAPAACADLRVCVEDGAVAAAAPAADAPAADELAVVVVGGNNETWNYYENVEAL